MNNDKLIHVTRLKEDFPGFNEIMMRHREAIEKDEDYYIDPETGLVVFTSLFLYNRGYCCESGCRHCPYEIFG